MKTTSGRLRGFSPRLAVQLAFTALSNGYISGFLHGKIYQGELKRFCVPGLNCYSCPGALGSCPIGSLQAVIASPKHHMSFYVLGFLIAVGALCGRLVCGFLCPFGLVQDLLYRIPTGGRKLRKIPGEIAVGKLRYAVLLGFVILLPMFAVNIIGQGDPWFCKYICPAGTLMGGIPLVLIGEGFREAAGALFDWKLGVLIAVVLFSVFCYRPFCRLLCPLGAIYGLMNPVSLFRYRWIEARCNRCGACRKACKLGLDPVKNPNDPRCIRCGECVRACAKHAIIPAMTFGLSVKTVSGSSPQDGTAPSHACGGHCQTCRGCGEKG